ncbi:hypothetical protein ES703_123325 [subsurface metagenome]
MAEKVKISPAVIIGGGLLLGVGAAVGLFALARAAPPEVYTCPVCGDESSTLEDVQYHFTT